MALNNQSASSSGEKSTPHEMPTDGVFALENVTQLREAIEQAVYGDQPDNVPNEPERSETIEGLTTLGQMGLLTETDLDEAKKGYL